MSNSGKFTKWNTFIVRINHPVLQGEIHDIAKDLDIPVQYVFEKVLDRVFEDYDVDAMLLKVVEDLEHLKEEYGDIPF